LGEIRDVSCDYGGVTIGRFLKKKGRINIWIKRY